MKESVTRTALTKAQKMAGIPEGKARHDTKGGTLENNGNSNMKPLGIHDLQMATAVPTK